MPLRCGRPLAPAASHNLTLLAGCVLPQEYLSFLTRWNGVLVDGPDYVDVPFSKVDNGMISFLSLFGFGASNENFDLTVQNTRFRSELAFLHDAFIIGDDPGGNFYLLARHENGYPLYYWDRTHLHANDVHGSPDIAEIDECGGLYLVAESFAAFWSMIAGQLNKLKNVEVLEQDLWPTRR